MPESLKSQVIKGTIWNGLERFGTAFFLFLSNLVLARLLSPDDFGCIGMLMVFISVSDAIVDGGFGAALVQKKDVRSIDYSTIFIWNVIVSVALYIVLFISSPAIASFYNIDYLEIILKVQGIVLLFNGLCIIQRSMFQRDLMFKKLAKINLSATIIGTLLGIICAFAGLGVWSLVAKLLFTSVIASMLLWVKSDYLPSLKFSWKSFSTLFNFGSFMFLTSMTNSIHSNSISLVIGKGINSAALGYFTQAQKLEDIPRQTLSSVVMNVAFPAFSKLQDSQKELVFSVRATTRLLSYINFSLTILMMVVARPLILLLFSEKWERSISYFQMICLFGLIYTITEFYNSILKAKGESRILFITNLIYKVLGVLLIFWGAFWGMRGILLTFVVSYYIGFALVSYAICKTIHYTFASQIGDLLPSLVIAFISGLATWLAMTIVDCDHHVVSLLIGVSIFMSVSILASHIIKFEPYCFLKDLVKRNH